MEGDGAGAATPTAAVARVQHITKASSDELLNKFAQVGSRNNDNKLALALVKNKNKNTNKKKDFHSSKRQKRNRAITDASICESPLNAVADSKSLLPPASNRRSTALIRQLGIGKARKLKNKSIFRTIEKTWHKTVEGASKMFIEKHYNRHKRLISEIV